MNHSSLLRRRLTGSISTSISKLAPIRMYINIHIAIDKEKHNKAILPDTVIL